MTHGVATIEIKNQRGVLVVNGLGRTPRGQKFIALQEALTVKSVADPAFKAQMAAAVKKILP